MKQFRKKAIASLAALALASLISLTQVTSVSADDYTQHQITQHEISISTYRREIKLFKTLLMQKFFGQSHNRIDMLTKIENLETEFLKNNKKSEENIVWKEGYSRSAPDTNYFAGELEDSFTTEQFKKFGKSDGEAAKLADEYLHKLMEFYQTKL
ncbi:hypothetical protein [Streptococcus halichoeri]|uniref:hypothetical protein n=1 Tax=Streptococcus halichoeri TaxID=254785 RepID=UPI00135795AE|nr:hypothetical protein [Streptococcus halichoeri]